MASAVPLCEIFLARTLYPINFIIYCTCTIITKHSSWQLYMYLHVHVYWVKYSQCSASKRLTRHSCMLPCLFELEMAILSPMQLHFCAHVHEVAHDMTQSVNLPLHIVTREGVWPETWLQLGVVLDLWGVKGVSKNYLRTFYVKRYIYCKHLNIAYVTRLI